MGTGPGVDVHDADSEQIGQVAEVRDDVFIVMQGMVCPTHRTISYEHIAMFDHLAIRLNVAREQLRVPANVHPSTA
ncbi:MAG: hypothetical protein ACJ789_03970 [Thermomicrobiales bacterium]